MNWIDRILALVRPDPVPVPVPPPIPVGPPPDFREQLRLLFNASRGEFGLPYLAGDARCDRAAIIQSDTQAARRRMGHDGPPGGNTAGDRLRREGYAWSGAAENVGAGYPDVPAINAAWMASPPHRANILGPYRHVGFGVATGTDGLRYWTAVFASPAVVGMAPALAAPALAAPASVVLSGPIRIDDTH